MHLIKGPWEVELSKANPTLSKTWPNWTRKNDYSKLSWPEPILANISIDQTTIDLNLHCTQSLITWNQNYPNTTHIKPNPKNSIRLVRKLSSWPNINWTRFHTTGFDLICYYLESFYPSLIWIDQLSTQNLLNWTQFYWTSYKRFKHSKNYLLQCY